MARYYDNEANLIEQVPHSKEDRMVKINIGHVKKLGLLPDVATVLALNTKAGLENWKIEHAIRLARTTPKHKWETEDDWMSRIIEDAKEISMESLRIGDEFPPAVEAAFSTDKEPFHPVHAEAYRAIKKMVGNPHVGVAFASRELGWAGKASIVTPKSIAGIRTTGAKVPKAKPEWGLPLAMCAMGLNKPNHKLVTFVVNRMTGDVTPFVWGEKGTGYTPAELGIWAHRIFQCWCSANKYDPRETNDE